MGYARTDGYWVNDDLIHRDLETKDLAMKDRIRRFQGNIALLIARTKQGKVKRMQRNLEQMAHFWIIYGTNANDFLIPGDGRTCDFFKERIEGGIVEWIFQELLAQVFAHGGFDERNRLVLKKAQTPELDKLFGTIRRQAKNGADTRIAGNDLVRKEV